MLKKNIELIDTLTSLSEQINAIAYSLPMLKDEHRNIFFVELMCKSDLLTQQLKSIDLCGNSKAHNLKNSTATQNSFAGRLRLALAHSGMTQTTLAGLIGVSQGTISALVTGKSKESGIARCGEIAQILGVSADWLRYGEGEMTSFNFSR